jgi:DNA-binding SARP family transcriptional activator
MWHEEKMLETDVLRIQMFGPFQAWRHQKVLAWPTQKSKALFQILMIEPGRLVSTDQIMEYLWPDLPPLKAQNNLWVTVSQLRRVLQPDLQPRAHSAYIYKRGEGYCFNSDSDYWLDAETFATYQVAAQLAPNLIGKIEGWEAARNIYHGDYLEDEPYVEWAQIPRAQWRRRYEQLLVKLAGAYERNGCFQHAITHCRELLILENTNETAYQLLMRCFAALGERSAALKVYDEAVQALQDEIGVTPMPETAELARKIKLLDGDWRLETEILATPSLLSPISSPFVGRGREIEQFTRLLTRAATGQGQLALISGEPGIGKSRIIQETTVLASQQGFHPLSARCYQVEQTMTYQPLIDLVRQVMAYDDCWQQLAPVWLRELVILVPEMGDMAAAGTTVSPTIDEPDENQQARLFQAIFHLFANQTDQYKLFLVIEDIHWADPATLQCLHYLVRNIARIPIALFFTLRGESLSTDADLNAMIHSLRQEVHVQFLSLGRLTEDDTTMLLEQMADTAANADRLGYWLYKETDGNPFFLMSLLQSMREGKLLDEAAKTDWGALARIDPTLTLPDAIRDLVRDRLQRLTQAEREALDWMAVHGRPIDFSTLQAISHQPQMTLLNAVEQLEDRQLLVETTGEYDFGHNKISEVVYYDLSTPRRSLYHRQIAETMEVLPIPSDKASLVAHHFERGGENEKALSYWMRAGKHALETYAYQQAARHYERALALTDQPTTQMDAYLGLGRAFSLQDDHKAATVVIKRGLKLAERFSDDARHARLLYTQAQNASRQHRPDGGKPEVEAALLAAEQAGDEYYLAQSLLLLTEVHESSGDLSSALETASRAQIVSSKLNDNQLEARSLVEIGFLHAQRAEFNEAVNAAEGGLSLLAETDDRNAIAYAWNILGRALGGRGDYRHALDAFHQSQEEAQIVRDRLLLAQAFNMQGWLHRELGDYKSALNFDEKGVDLAERWSKPSPEISARLNVCLDVLRLGDPERALVLLDEIEVQINAGSFGFHNWRWRVRLLHARGLCYLVLDDPAKVLGIADEGLLLAETGVIRKYIALNHELRGMALAELGGVDEAIYELETAVALADTIQYQPVRWASRQRLAKLYLQIGREGEAKNTSSEAEDIIQTIASSLEDETLRVIFLKAALSQ